MTSLQNCITYRKHQRVFQRLIVSLRNGQYHRVLHGARIELGWTNKIADIFKYRKVDIIRAKSGESLTRHVRIKMAHGASFLQPAAHFLGSTTATYSALLYSTVAPR